MVVYGLAEGYMWRLSLTSPANSGVSGVCGPLCNFSHGKCLGEKGEVPVRVRERDAMSRFWQSHHPALVEANASEVHDEEFHLKG